ncbi:MAG: hypothetical protein ACW99F_10715 [Candidatus Hodarchaeales archaeon]|jgi:Ser-tRNA(Ala) deacylase AlaX
MIPKSVSDIRIISIGEYDYAACGGTHVSNTGEIGELQILGTKNKGKLRERYFYAIESNS